MDKRLIALTVYLKENGTQTAETLAGEFKVSKKTIRKFIGDWNSYFSGKGAMIQSKHGIGYYLTIENQDLFEQYFKELTKEQKRVSVPSTSEERVEYLLNDLLSRRDFVKMDDLSDILFISKKTISSDLKMVEKVLEEYNLRLEKKPNYGIRITGKEFDRRLCIANVIVGKDKAIYAGEDKNYKDFVNRVAKTVAEVIDEERFAVHSIAYQNLIVHICIGIQRIREGCYVPFDENHWEKMIGTREYEVAKKLAEKINRDFDTTFPEEEIVYIAIHLAGKQSLFLPQLEEQQNQVISQETWEVVTRMLEVVYEAFSFDFRNDLELRMNLAQHIVPLAVRLKYNMKLENPLLRDIKARFPMAYAMALHASSILTEYYENELKDDEVGYIALAFALAIERLSTELPKKNILIVCASGKGSAQLLEYRYRQEFGSYVNRIETCDVSNLKKFNFSDIDYVFTTIPIKDKVPVPVQEVKYFLESEDIQNMKKALQSMGESIPLLAYFEKGLFFPHLKFESRHEVMKYLCSQVMEKKGFPNTFWKFVKKRESLGQTAFGNRVAMPHPWKAISEETFVCVGILDEPVSWGDQMVQAVFLVSISKKKNKNLRDFYQGMTRILTDPEAIQSLIATQTYEELQRLL